MATVTFSKNMTKQNRDAGLKWLKFYFNQSPLAQFPYYPITNYDSMIKYMDEKYVGLVEFIGETSFDIGDAKMQDSMRDLAYNGKFRYPIPADFSNAVIPNAGITAGDKINAITEGLSESAKEIGAGIVSYSKMIPYIVGGALFLVIFLKLGGGSAIAQNFHAAKRSNPRRKK